MNHNNYNIINHIRNKYFDELKEYSPFIRQAKLFKFSTEEIPLKITDTDYIAGWYGYEDDSIITIAENKSFEHTDVLSSEQKKLIEHLKNDLKTIIVFTPAHT